MWQSGERDSVIANFTARVTITTKQSKQFKEIGIVHQASCPTKSTSIVVAYATSSQSLELDVCVIVSTSCD
jgi:hypothetical protein